MGRGNIGERITLNRGRMDVALLEDVTAMTNAVHTRSQSPHCGYMTIFDNVVIYSHIVNGMPSVLLEILDR